MEGCISGPWNKGYSEELGGTTARFARLALVLGTLLAIPASAADPGVKGIRYWSLGDMTRVVVELSSNFSYTTERLSNPDRYFFDIRGGKPEMPSRGVHVIPVSDGVVGQIRVGENQPGVTRIVFDLLKPVTVNTSQFASPPRLVVEIRSKEQPPPPVTPAISVRRSIDPSELGTVSRELARVINPEYKDSSLANARISPPLEGRENPPLTIVPESASRVPPSVEEQPKHAPVRVARRFVPPPERPVRPISVREPEMPAAPKLDVAAKAGRFPSFSQAFPELQPPPPAPVIARINLPPVAATALPPLPPPIAPQAVPPQSAAPRSGGNPQAAKDLSNSMTRVLGLKLGRIVLDPGHGGQDHGTHGASGLLEKDLVLDVAQRVGLLLEERLGSEVVFTRSSDEFVPLEERTKLANETKADLFLSIHANSSPARSAAGVETYVLNFSPTKAANDVAARENAASFHSIHELKDLVEKIAANDKANESREFALRLQNSLSVLSTRNVDQATNRGVKRAPFVVLIGASMPSVLAEIGFLTNPNEESLLRKPEYRQKIAEALYKGIANYADTLSRSNVARKIAPDRSESPR